MATTSYDVPLIPQPTKLSGWVGAMAMLLNFRRPTTSMDTDQIAGEVKADLRTVYEWKTLEAVKDHYGFQAIELPADASPYPTPAQWSSWLTSYGPLWLTTNADPSLGIIIRGVDGDLTLDGTQVMINNPVDTTMTFSRDDCDFDPGNPGRAYQQSFTELNTELGAGQWPNYSSWRVLYLPA